MQTVDQLIAPAPVFAGLEQSQLELIAGCARNEHLEADILILREGEPADRFYLIRRGTVALEVHAPGRGPLQIETLGSGDVVGWSWLFEPYRWALDGRTQETCELITFDGACLRGKCEADHELGYQLMRRFAANMVQRLNATRLQLLDVYGHARDTA
jgi:CRP/FNR family transcriptional regulator, cyclic AMP receptor protein